MSQHWCEVSKDDYRYRVVAGYDRILRDFFLNVEDLDSEEMAFSSLEWPQIAWKDIHAIRSALANMQLVVPETLFEQIENDQRVSAGNRMVEHRFDAPPIVHLDG